MTATISIDDDLFTLVNVFTVRPDDAEALLEVLTNATIEVMQHIPGFVSANLHVSRDRERIVNYAQWTSENHFDAMLARDDARQHMKRATALAVSFEPIRCTVASATSREST